MRLLVTRPVEDAEPLKQRLEALGHEVILSPLLVIAPRPAITIPAENYQAVALTSANAVRSLEGGPHLDGLRHLPVMAVGPQSATAARQAGFAQITEAGGDGVGLARHVIASLDPNAGPVLYLSGQDTASDFTGLLERGGLNARRVVVYEAKPAGALAPEAAKAQGVLLYSPRSAKIWLDLVQRHAIPAGAMVHYCLSANIAAILPDAFARRVAARPVDDALLEVIGHA
ncbi:uroporphyrinogen-III synthase [Nordella sp. HKS 07]|uniref:uroporphyrinogen-III synthase n=1 Tax=Nordella sp. HKS 07 TaxID=2712222 RepID=UPI0013E112E9|nr:uroporphyrinogen-III synthase [Nordella sp. HKS 07]QIG48012.1 uroporphyrinogen-III synthase [Nordella sp. HKS 07]